MNMLKAEWKKIFSRPMSIITIVGLLFVPFFYGLIFLSAYWDPYGNTDQLPVAVVNLDQGADYHGKRLDIGSKFVEQLEDNTTFKWSFPDKESALKGLEDESYYLVIEIPANFSKDATTVMDEKPIKMKLNYYTNPGKNYPGSQISNAAMVKINEQIDSEVTKEYTRSLFDSLSDISSSFQKASNAAGELDTGGRKLEDGSKELHDKLELLASSTVKLQKGVSDLSTGADSVQSGLKEARSGAAQLSDGLQGVNSGAVKLQEGSVKLADGLQQLGAGAQKLHGGSQELNNGISKLDSGLKSSVSGASQLKQQLEAYSGKMAELAQAMSTLAGQDGASEQLKQLSASLGELQKGAQQLEAAAGKLADGQQQLSGGAQQLVSGGSGLEQGLLALGDKLKAAQAGAVELSQGSQALQAGTGKLAAGGTSLVSGLDKLINGQQQLVGGMKELSNASGQLQSGSRQLADGAGSLHNGAKSLAEGTGKLHNALQDGADQTGVHADEETYDMFAAPTELEGHKLHEIPSYGVGLAPYILSIALYAGAMMFASAYSLKEAAIRPRRGYPWFLSKLSVVVIVSFLSSVLVDSVLLLGLGLEVQSMWMFYLFTFITSLTFFSIVFMLFVALNNVGLYVAFLLLLLQIGGSGGTFPSLLTPGFFQALHPFLPMTHSINGFRQIISIGTDYSIVWQQAGILGGYTALALLVAAGLFALQARKIEKSGHWEHVALVDEE
ncbi:YhgE/Pip domain-containing protein [Paenibacillus sp. SYP-B4298]|uniref:YhgE/Pip domain-containing protein n=1 Tax=Paenibacillus sp. SYP-B4298 TaxID=2996034 RepID=UPI0022DE66F2|nr:YhgE/Pip domain-containing protein [Paenibacillus sp. SYP-B4298]